MISFKTELFYIKIYKNKFEIKHICSGKILIVNAKVDFSNNRSVIADYKEFEVLLKESLIKILDKRIFPPTYKFVLHVKEKHMTNLSEVERRALVDSSEQINAIKVIIFEEETDLTDENVVKLLN